MKENGMDNRAFIILMIKIFLAIAGSVGLLIALLYIFTGK